SGGVNRRARLGTCPGQRYHPGGGPLADLFPAWPDVRAACRMTLCREPEVDAEKRTVELRNPPVIEVGIEFHFEPRPDREPWALPVAGPFIERFQASFPDVEVVQSEEIRIERRSPAGLPQRISGKIRLDRMRAHNPEGTRWLQVGNDLLVF